MADSERQRSSPLRLIVQALIALLVSALALGWSFKGVDLSALGDDLKKSSPLLMGLYVLAQLLAHGLRVLRWGLLLRPLGPITWRAIYAAASLGFPASFFLPLRLGELVRPVMASRAGVPIAGAMASVVVERMADGLVNLGLFFLFLGLLPAGAPIPDQLRSLATVALVGFGGGLVVLVAITIVRQPAIALVERLLQRISRGISAKVVALLTSFVDGVLALRSPARIAAFLSLTGGYWLLNGASTWLLATSYVDGLPFLAGPFTITVVVFAITIPAGPAFAGTLEAGFRLGLGAFGVVASTSAAIAIAVHVLTLFILAALAGSGVLLTPAAQRAKLADAGPGGEHEAG